MDSLLVIGWLGLFVIVFWPLALTRALSHIMSNAFFGQERPLATSEFRRFLLSTILLMLALALGLIIVSPSGSHPHAEYRQPLGALRLILSSFFAGLTLGAGCWALFRLKMRREAKFHHPSLATWKGLSFWGPKKRKMTLDERREFLRQMNLADYWEYVGLVGIFFTGMLPLLIVGVSLVLEAPARGFIPAFSLAARGLISAEFLLAFVGLFLGTILWLLGRLFVWLGWTRTLA